MRYKTYFAIGLMITAIACAETDPGITTAVKSRLAADDTVKARQIDVDTREKVVTLSGTVNTATEKTQAVAVARGTSGVMDVVDNITVAPMMPPGDAPAA